MEKLGLNILREKFLSFFEGKAHLRMPSFPLVPQGDNSLLLINSGMAPLKPFFAGEAIPPSKRVTTCQKCIRTPDIERVGRTSRHGTFFEMLGNFSFGDYFKREACAWAWEFITVVLEIPIDKLHVTVYLEDDETWDIWEHEIGVDPTHISRLGKEDNFWEIGSGPCGPCSEIYFDRGEENGCGDPNCAPGCDCDRYVEFWNLVFTQFNNDGQGNYTELTNKNIDTGMGLERLACIMQGVPSLFDVDTVMNITSHVSELTGAEYGKTSEMDVSLRVITDHIRSTTMMVSDGIRPSNEGRGYVLRRLLRRAARHGKLLGCNESFLYKVCETVIEESRAAYPELDEKREYIVSVIKGEEDNFARTIDLGMNRLTAMLEQMHVAHIDAMSGEDSFRLHDTYGFPIDLTLEILAERGLTLDRDGFDTLMARQRKRAREATAALGDFGWEGLDLGLDPAIATEFLGYTDFESDAEILAIVSDGEAVDAAGTGENAVLVLDRTPFYAESGGQISDTGVITAQGMIFDVDGVHASRDGKYYHSGTVREGVPQRGQRVSAVIDAERRRAIMRAHSATHLLHKSLRNVLGTHVEQAGSLVTPDYIRFDFTHPAGLTREELLRIDEQVNDIILSGLEINTTETDQETAHDMGAMALFGEKYGDIVRVVSMGGYSTELCGGTHLDNTAKVGSYRTVSEGSVSAGVRRIEASVGKGVLEQLRTRVQVIDRLSGLVKTSPQDLEHRIETFLAEMTENRRLLARLREQQQLTEAQQFLYMTKEIAGLKVLTTSLPGASADDMRRIGDFLRDKEPRIVAVIASVTDDKIAFYATCGKDAVSNGIKAGNLIKEVCAIAGGTGGGKPDSAMGGGKEFEKVDDALACVDDFIVGAVKE